MQLKSVLAIFSLLLASCSPPRATEVPGRYLSEDGEIVESLTLLDNGVYLHTWDLLGAHEERGRWSYRTGSETDCPTLRLSDFTVVKRVDRKTAKVDTFVTCVDTFWFGGSFIVTNGDLGVYLRKAPAARS